MSVESRRRARLAIDGVLLLDKPVGITSNAALQAAKRLFSAAKAGHTGTLDPLASGLLPICFGEATKFGAVLLDADKRYVARIKLGVRTSTGDAEGEVLERRTVAVDEAALDAAVARFRGEIRQLPPMHSALKHAGRALYEYARAGIAIERTPRPVRIHALVWRDFAGDELTLEVRCSKGTYIRTLAEDLGAALGCGAHLAALRRTGVGEADVEQALGLEGLETLPADARVARLLPADHLLAALPAVTLGAEAAGDLRQGREAEAGSLAEAGLCRAYGPGERFLGLVEATCDGRLRPRRLIAGDPRAGLPEPCANS
jgi:tRNA pseudouridine55 synthase